MTEDRDSPTRESEVSYYKCPRCGYVNDDERWVRTHITVLTDHEHEGHEGHSDAQEVVLLDDEGVEISQEKGCGLDRKADVRPKELPEEIANKQRKILAVVLSHPSLQRTEIADILKEGYDYPTAYPGYVSQVIQKYLKRGSEGDQSDQLISENVPDETPAIEAELSEMNQRQRRAAEAVAIHQMTYEEIGRRIGENEDYLGRISRRFPGVVEHHRDEFFDQYYDNEEESQEGDKAINDGVGIAGEARERVETECGNNKYSGPILEGRWKYISTRETSQNDREGNTATDGGLSRKSDDNGKDTFENTKSKEEDHTVTLPRSNLWHIQELIAGLRRASDEGVISDEEALNLAFKLTNQLFDEVDEGGDMV